MARDPGGMDIDLEDLANSIVEIIDDLDAGSMSGFVGLDEEDTDDEEEPDAEEEEYESGTLAEEVKRYQREFRRYIRMIRKGLEDLGYVSKARRGSGNGMEYSHGSHGGSKDGARSKARDPQDDITPWDRGHKWGCGCPGCTSFREAFLSESVTDFSIPDTRSTGPDSGSKEPASYDPGHKDNVSDYPCGGKLRGMFKGGFLKYTLAGVGKKPGMMNYLAV